VCNRQLEQEIWTWNISHPLLVRFGTAHPLGFTAVVDTLEKTVIGIEELPIQTAFDTQNRQGDALPKTLSNFDPDVPSMFSAGSTVLLLSDLTWFKPSYCNLVFLYSNYVMI